MSDFLEDVWETTKDSLEVTLNPSRWDELLEAPKRHFKQITETTLGQIAMTALAAWGAGAALGAMGGAAGAAGGAGTGAATGTTAAEGLIAGASGAGQAGPVAAANTATGTISQGAVMPNVAGEALTAGIQQGGVSAGTQGVVQGGVQGAVQSGANTGFGETVGNAWKNFSSWTKNNPELSSAMFNGLSTALSPDELDMMREHEKLRQERLDRQNRNLEGVADIDLGFGPGSSVLRDQFGNPVHGQGSGIVQRHLGRKPILRDEYGSRLNEEEDVRVGLTPRRTY